MSLGIVVLSTMVAFKSEKKTSPLTSILLLYGSYFYIRFTGSSLKLNSVQRRQISFSSHAMIKLMHHE